MIAAGSGEERYQDFGFHLPLIKQQGETPKLISAREGENYLYPLFPLNNIYISIRMYAERFVYTNVGSFNLILGNMRDD